MKKEDITRFIGYQLSHEDQAIREPVRNLKGITLRTSLLPLFLDLLKENTSLLVKTNSQVFFVRFVEQRECCFFFLRKLTDCKNLRVMDMDQYLVTDCLKCQPF